MPTYTNPSGTFNATDSDDTITFTAAPIASLTADALGGNDSLAVQFDNSGPIRFGVYNGINANSFDVQFSVDPFTPVYVLHVEQVELHGSANNDTFNLTIGPNSSALTVSMDGGAAQDLLTLFASSITAGLSFVVSGSSITSSFGTFSNFEVFDIRAGSGDDTITTGSGDDAVETGSGLDHVSTGAGNDSIYIESTGGTFDAGDGNDWVSLSVAAGSSGFTVDGGLGQDQLNLGWTGTSGQSFVFNGSTFSSSLGTFSGFETINISAGSGADSIATAAGDDSIYGGAGDDTISAGDGKNSVSGADGNDSISAGGGNDTLSGGAGNDTISAGDGIDTIYGDQNVYSSIGDGNDQIDGGAGNDSIYGGGGDDTIGGGVGNDYLVGGRGSDHIDGGDGNDHIDGFGEYGYGPDDNLSDTLIGGAGDDVITAGYGDSVDGGTGTDQLYYSAFGASSGINVNFSTLTSGGTISVAGATLSGIEYVVGISGTDFNDTIIAGAVPGVDGASISGWGGDDDLTGSSGTDYIYGGDGNDVIHGGVGYNPSVYPSTDRLNGEAGNDTIYSGPDGALVSGGTGNDTIYGGAGADDIRGDAGDDRISGGGGHDGLNGGDGNDTFVDTAANFNGDIIGDFDVGDAILITDVNLSNFTFSLTGHVLTYTGGSLTFGLDVPGTIIASAASGGGVQLTLRTPPLGTIDQIASQLMSGFWNGDSHHWAVTQGGTLTVNISTLNATEQTLARAALQEWTDIIGVHFQEVLTGGQIVFDHSEDPSGPIAAADGNWSNGIINSQHIHISSSWVNQYGTGLNSYSFQTYVHEIGHALGLGHPGNYNETGSYYSDALFANDAWSISVMSYFDQQENRYFYNQNFSENFVLTPMQADIVATQAMYGASTTTRSGDSVYGFHSNAGGIYDASVYGSAAFTIFDSGGIDTLDYSLAGNAQTINLNPETFSSVNAGRGNLSIARGVVIENAIGGTANDIIIGNSADNIITGNLYTDILTGGAGNDTFRDTQDGLSGDTITDFSAGDRIVITDANLDGFSFGLSGNILSYTGGYLTLSSVPAGHIVAQAAAGGGVQLVVLQHDPDNDFNGDGRSDILWREDSGTITNWLGQASGGFSANWANSTASVPNDWKIAGIGDFSGDGRDDVLWRNDNGLTVDWLGAANGGFTDNFGNSAANVGTDWKVAGIGDFNGDGKDDILWRNDSGLTADWLGAASGGFSVNYVNSAVNVPTNWKVAGTGDFNGDGRDDILWRDSATGLTVDWLGTANGGFSDNYAASAVNVPTEWKVAGTGDFNGDGRDDIQWRSDGGMVTEWLGGANGGFSSNWANVAVNVPTDWKIAQIGDFNGDGRDDILWRNDNGQTTDWLGTASGGFTDNYANAAAFVPTDWHVQAHFETFV